MATDQAGTAGPVPVGQCHAAIACRWVCTSAAPLVYVDWGALAPAWQPTVTAVLVGVAHGNFGASLAGITWNQ